MLRSDTFEMSKPKRVDISWTLLTRFYVNSKNSRGCSRYVIVKVIDCRIVISEFELQLRY